MRIREEMGGGYHSQVDYWSFGFVVFEAITGVRPFGPQPLQDKRDDEICQSSERNASERPIFQKIIPPPHSLNHYLEESITEWLRLMLRINERRRGGENFKWFRILKESIIPVNFRYVKVLDVTSMELKTFKVELRAMPQTLIRRIESELNIPASDQFLIMEKGQVPIVTQSILQQIRDSNAENPEEAIVYLFNKSVDKLAPFVSKTPSQIQRYYDSRENLPSDFQQQYKRFFHICLHDTLSKCKVGLKFVKAIDALIYKVDRISRNLEELCSTFQLSCQKAFGMIDLFKVSLEEDIASNNDQDNSSGIRTNDEFSNHCISLLQDVKEWEKELSASFILINDARLELRKRMDQPMDENKNFRELITRSQSSAINFCLDFRTEIKNNKRRDHLVDKIRQFVRDFWAVMKRHLEDALNPTSKYRTKMKFYIHHHVALERIFFSMMEKSQNIVIMQEKIMESQKNRQHRLWIMLQYMRDVYDAAAQFEKNDEPEQNLASAVDSFNIFTEQLMMDPDLCGVINLVKEEELSMQDEVNRSPNPVAAENPDS